MKTQQPKIEKIEKKEKIKENKDKKEQTKPKTVKNNKNTEKTKKTQKTEISAKVTVKDAKTKKEIASSTIEASKKKTKKLLKKKAEKNTKQQSEENKDAKTITNNAESNYKNTPFNIVDKLDESERKEFENKGKGGKGIVLLDLTFYIPFDSPEDFDVQFGVVQDKTIDSLNGKKNPVPDKDDFKVNHRYPNRNTFTISKKYGRKVSKIGYPVIVDLDERQLLLKVVLTYHDNPVTMFFPVMINLTEDKPFATLLLKFDAGNAEIVFATTKFFSADEKTAKVRHKYYSNRQIAMADGKKAEVIYFKKPIKVPNIKNALVYSDLIALFSNPILVNV